MRTDLTYYWPKPSRRGAASGNSPLSPGNWSSPRDPVVIHDSAVVFLGRRQGYKNPDEHYLASLSTTTSPRTLSTSPHLSTSASIIMGWFGDDSQEAQHYDDVLRLPRSQSLDLAF